MTTASFGKPDFVILGYRFGDQCCLAASTELSSAEVEQVTWHPGGWGPLAGPGRTEIDMKVKMRRYMIVTGSSYQEAFRTLMPNWKPPPSDGPVPDPVPELGYHRPEVSGR